MARFVCSRTRPPPVRLDTSVRTVKTLGERFNHSGAEVRFSAAGENIGYGPGFGP